MDNEKLLAKYRRSALTFTNRIRRELGLPALDALLPGSISVAEACVVTKSIEAHGLYGSTNYQNVQIFAEPISEEQYCEVYTVAHNAKKGQANYVAKGENTRDPDHTHLVPRKTFKVPELTKQFLEMFDSGCYPDLATDSEFEEV